MKKYLLLIVALIGGFASKAQVPVPFQELPYNIKYHWGLIDVNIARGTVTLESDGRQISGTLDGTSIPWEGKVLCVSDTLRANVNDLNEYVTYQSGWYRHVPVSTYRSGAYNPDDPAYYRNIAGRGNYSASGNSMHAVTVTSDMIGMFYYAHLINFEALRPGETVQVNIGGGYSRRLDITYKGKNVTNIDGMTYPTYDCTFIYSYDGIEDYPVECKISATDRIPVLLSASLPIGEVEMIYAP